MTKKSALILLFTLLSVAVFSQNAQPHRTVRVGCMNQHQFIERNDDGTFSGYAVEYLEELCSYTGWNVEYVVASWADLLKMLENGQIDLLPFAQYTEERTDTFAYSRQPMDTVQGLLWVRDENKDIFYNEYSAFDGKTVGVLKGDQSIALLRRFADLHNFEFSIKEYPYHKDSIDALNRGEVDLIATEQVVGRGGLRIVAHFGSAPSYFLLNKNETALLDELNEAMNDIYSKDGTYRSRLYQKYYGGSIMHSRPIFTRDEIEYINKRRTVDVVLVPDSQPGSYMDEDGNYVGIVPDIIRMVGELSGLEFNFHYSEPGVPPLVHLQNNPNDILGGVLAINPAFRHPGLLMSETFFKTYTALVADAGNTENIDFVNGSYRLGIPPAFQALILYVQEHYPNLTIDTSHVSIMDNLKALEKGEIDLFCCDMNMILHYLGNPRLNKIRIVSTSFIEEPECCVAVNTPENKILMRIMNKCFTAIPQEKMQDVERYHVSKNYYRPTFGDTLYRMRALLLMSGFLVLTIYVFLTIIIRKSHAAKDLMAQKNEELFKSVQRAENASKAKSEFLSRMSHDIRTPMNAIMGMTELARAENVQNPRVKEYLKKIDVSARVLLRLLNDILDATALERGKLQIVHVPFDLQKEILLVVSLYETQCAYKNIKFVTDFSEVRHNALIGDALRVNQIVLNLLSNAVKFTSSSGQITYTVKETECEGDTVTLELTVSDTGCGIDEEMLTRLWQPFEQKNAMTGHKYGGSGLGMNIAKNLTTLLHGTINVESHVDKGTTFTVTLPFEIDRDAEEAKAFADAGAVVIQNATGTQNASIYAASNGAGVTFGANASGKDAFTGGTVGTTVNGAPKNNGSASVDVQKTVFDFTGKTVLIADDDLFNREVVSGLLERVNATCVCFENGKDAADAFINAPEGSFDMLMLDVHMPVMGGYEATACIRSSKHAEAKSIPIFAFTADTFPEDIEKAKQNGMNGHIAKPVYSATLYEKLDKVFTLYKDVREKSTGGGIIPYGE